MVSETDSQPGRLARVGYIAPLIVEYPLTLFVAWGLSGAAFGLVPSSLLDSLDDAGLLMPLMILVGLVVAAVSMAVLAWLLRRLLVRDALVVCWSWTALLCLFIGTFAFAMESPSVSEVVFTVGGGWIVLLGAACSFVLTMRVINGRSSGPHTSGGSVEQAHRADAVG